jgi:hypothetical protein
MAFEILRKPRVEEAGGGGFFLASLAGWFLLWGKSPEARRIFEAVDLASLRPVYPAAAQFKDCTPAPFGMDNFARPFSCPWQIVCFVGRFW